MTNNKENSVGMGRYINLDEIVFQKRNKDYGAYWLRKRYKRAVIVAFFISFVVITSVVVYPLIQAWRHRNDKNHVSVKNVSVELAKVETQTTPPPPPPPPPPVDVVKAMTFKAPEVVDSVKINEPEFEFNMENATNNAPPADLNTPTEAPKKEEIVEKVEEVFVVVEESATFQGGDVNGFRNWVQGKLVYPAEAAEQGVSGKVIVQFAVNSKGKLVDAVVVRGVHPSLDKEVLKVLAESPAWSAARQGGKNVKQQFTIPIVFNLQ
jgi:protein TonB